MGEEVPDPENCLGKLSLPGSPSFGGPKVCRSGWVLISVGTGIFFDCSFRSGSDCKGTHLKRVVTERN